MDLDLFSSRLKWKLGDVLSQLLVHRSYYHYHIRKTAGTSINHAFITFLGNNNSLRTYEKLAKAKNHRLISNFKVIAGWNKELLETGNYHYGFSHTPAHQIQLPTDVIKLTCFRDPLERLLSHYYMLRYYKLNDINHPCMKVEGKWVERDFEFFMKSIPKNQMLNQLFMFSPSFSIDQVLEVLNKQNVNVLFTNTLSADIQHLNSKYSLSLALGKKEKAYGFIEPIPIDQLQIAREILEPEFRLFKVISTELV